MGMARLAIVDAAQGQQPFRSSTGRYHVVFNGEIYNWQALRRELEARGHRFSTHCDGEVLPAGWETWGAALFPKLNGMFAIAIYDTHTHELVVARDHCGQKPLYYTLRDGAFSFASEVRALRLAGGALSPNRSALAGYLLNRYVSEPATLFREVEVLPAAHWMRVTPEGQVTLTRFWAPVHGSAAAALPDTDWLGAPPSSSLPEALDQLDAVARESVRLTMQSDWKSALYLSSGVDSNLLAQYACELDSEVSSISIGFRSASDETAAAAESAAAFGLPHHTIQLGSDSLEELPRIITQMERPVGDALILAFDALASKSREIGAKVAYGAEGIDEHFGGYSFHKAYLKAQKLGPVGRWGAQRFLSLAPDALVDRLANFPASLGKEGKGRVQRYLQSFTSLSPDLRADYLRFLYEPSELATVLSGALPDTATTGRLESGAMRMNALLARQYDSWLQDWSLIRQDKNTMAHSIEYRSPFLDPALIQFAFSMREDWKIRGREDKWIWRKLAEKRLPPEIAWRPKVPFYLPLEQAAWRAKLVEMSHDILTPQALSTHGWIQPEEVQRLQQSSEFLPLKKIASLLIFQLWYNTFF